MTEILENTLDSSLDQLPFDLFAICPQASWMRLLVLVRSWVLGHKFKLTLTKQKLVKVLYGLLFCLSFITQADEISTEPIESPYFRPVAKKWQITGILDVPFYTFYLGAPAVKGVAYLPNFMPRFGPRIIYKGTGATLTFNLGLPQAERERRGTSKQSSYIINSYWRQFAIDAYLQQYKGFYVSNPFTELSFKKPDRYPQLPDAEVKNYGLNIYFAFDSDHYSFKSGLDQQELQTKSGGSWILNPFFNHLELSIGNQFIPGSGGQLLTALPNLGSGRFDTLGCSVGYGYTYARNAYFATIQGAWGPAFQIQNVRKEVDEDNTYAFAAKLNLNFATGWNYSEELYGFKFLADSLWAKVESTQVTSTLIKLTFFYGRRF